MHLQDSFGLGDYLHLYNRGVRRQDIVKDDEDRWHFTKMLFYLNDHDSRPNILREIKDLPTFGWPAKWSPRKPLVQILVFCLMDNHYHILVREIVDGGTRKFMQKLGTSMTRFINTKYGETGALFEGRYKVRTLPHNSDDGEKKYLKGVAVLSQVKNPFERYPGGLENAMSHWDEAWEQALGYKFSSLPDYELNRNWPICDMEPMRELFPAAGDFKEYAREQMYKPTFMALLGKVGIDDA